MKLTNNCIKYLKEELEKLKLNTVELHIMYNCCTPGLSFHIGFINSNDYITIDGINFKIDKSFEKEIENLLIDYKNNMFYFDEI